MVEAWVESGLLEPNATENTPNANMADHSVGARD